MFNLELEGKKFVLEYFNVLLRRDNEPLGRFESIETVENKRLSSTRQMYEYRLTYPRRLRFRVVRDLREQKIYTYLLTSEINSSRQKQSI